MSFVNHITQSPYFLGACEAIGDTSGSIAQEALVKIASPEHRHIARSLGKKTLPTSLSKARAWSEAIKFHALGSGHVNVLRPFRLRDAATIGWRFLTNLGMVRKIADRILVDTTKVDEALSHNVGWENLTRLGAARNPEVESGPKIVMRRTPNQSPELSNVVFNIIDSAIAPPGMVYAEWQMVAGSQRFAGYVPASWITYVPGPQ